MRVWRVETAAGFGPYSGRGWCKDDCYNAPHCPVPSKCGRMGAEWRRLVGAEESRPWHFGFDSLIALLTWFAPRPQWLEWLDEAGFGVSEYEVPEDRVLRGEAQLVFVLAEATRVSRVSCRTLAPRPDPCPS